MKIRLEVDSRRAPAGVLASIVSPTVARRVRLSVSRVGGEFRDPVPLRWTEVEPQIPVGAYERLSDGEPVIVNISGRTVEEWFSKTS